MRKPTPLPAEAGAQLLELLQKAKTKAEFQRAQCVWLRCSLGLSSDDVATAVGWTPTSVRRVQAKYLRDGTPALQGEGRGGRRHQNLTAEQEAEFLRGFLEEAQRGGMVEVSRVKAAYEQAVGRSVPKSTVYRMLDRHGWRKLVPRPHHSQSDSARQDDFKKNSPKSSRKKSGAKRRSAGTSG